MKINHNRVLRGLLAIAVLGIITALITHDQAAHAGGSGGGISVGSGTRTGPSNTYATPPPAPTGGVGN